MLDRQVYVYAEVDRLAGLRAGTARRWINGYQRRGMVYDPILRIEPQDTPWVRWGEFVETRMLAEFRGEVSTPRLRAAIDSLHRTYGIDYPLAHLRPYLSVYQRDLTIAGEDAGLSDDETVVRTGQRLLGDARWLVERATLGQEETGETVVAELPVDSAYPDIVINPMRYSGQPTFVGRRVAVATVAGMVANGERPEDLAADYGLSLQQVHDAVEYTKKYKLAA